ncbi:hypothetical protein EDB84DRAFT_1031557 [Lactarius hengduanensis]|nr:hypothetical protein EDB84DRAFT_1031557 [Lactarius hengduanensis]
MTPVLIDQSKAHLLLPLAVLGPARRSIVWLLLDLPRWGLEGSTWEEIVGWSMCQTLWHLAATPRPPTQRSAHLSIYVWGKSYSFLSETIAQHDAFFFPRNDSPLSAKARPCCDHSFFPDPAGQGQGGHAAVQVAIRRDDRDLASHRETQDAITSGSHGKEGPSPKRSSASDSTPCPTKRRPRRMERNHRGASIYSAVSLRSALSNAHTCRIAMQNDQPVLTTRDYMMTIFSGGRGPPAIGAIRSTS